MVTGGQAATIKYGSSTEILVHGSSSWTNSAPLPTPRAALVGATLNNKIVMTGTIYNLSSRLHLSRSTWNTWHWSIWTQHPKESLS